MEKTSFWRTKAGALTIGFVVATVSFIALPLNEELAVEAVGAIEDV